jgi:NitT/TauT family transport system substrate-binding protein
MIKTLLLVVVITIFNSCKKNSAPDNIMVKENTVLPKITIAYTDQPQSALIHIAFANGYFTEEGLIVSSMKKTYGKMALQMALENKADFATVAETPFMFSILNGEKIFIVANIDISSLNNGILARHDAGIKVPIDLKGKRIGFSSGTTSDFFLDAFLNSIGLNRKDIHGINLNPEEMFLAINSKKVDAVCTWNYPLTQMKNQLGPKGIVFYDKDIYSEIFSIIGKQEFIKKNPEIVKKLLRALIKAEKFAANNQNEAQQIMSLGTKIEIGLVKEIWPKFNYQVVLDKSLKITLEDETRWAMKNNLAKKIEMPDYDQFIYFEGLSAVRPEAVKYVW